MPRNMSFFLTTEQIRNKTKTVTRRRGWRHLKPGDIVNACVKCQGMKKGDKIEKICQLRIIEVNREQLSTITQKEVICEGFPEMGCYHFVMMFCKKMGGSPWQKVTRIEFEYI